MLNLKHDYCYQILIRTAGVINTIGCINTKQNFNNINVHLYTCDPSDGIMHLCLWLLSRLLFKQLNLLEIHVTWKKQGVFGNYLWSFVLWEWSRENTCINRNRDFKNWWLCANLETTRYIVARLVEVRPWHHPNSIVWLIHQRSCMRCNISRTIYMLYFLIITAHF